MCWRQSDADTRCDVDFVALDIERLGEDRNNTICKCARVSPLIVLPVLDHRKFIAPQSRQNVGFPKRCLEPRRNLPQQRVANSVAQSVIDMLEAIEIEQQHRELVAAPAMAQNGVLDPVHDRQSVWQARQNIMVSHERDTLFGLFPLGDIVHDNDEMSGHTLAVASDDTIGGEDARIAVRAFRFHFGGMRAEFICQRLVVRGVDSFLGVFRPVDFEDRFPQYFASRNLEHRFKRPVDEHNLHVLASFTTTAIGMFSIIECRNCFVFSSSFSARRWAVMSW